ncbi:MAG: periplasmic protein TonB [Thermoanaerobaculia bacterium]|jgi:protein TonB|nr:periplasmic protein TonB [Thermoanaerobaculia bacterium]
MFESTVVESKKQKVGIQRLLTLPVSVALHVVVVVAVVVGALWNIDFPTNSPAQVAQYSVASAPPPPPPPPPPPKAATATQVVKPVEVPKNIQEMAPTTVPEKVQPVATQASDAGVTGGVEGGVEGGVAGGVVGGVVGGVITEAPQPKAPDAPLRVGGDVKAPVAISKVDPVYPEVARKARISGIVIVECTISKNGDVTDIHVLKPLPFGLDQAAVDAVKRWKFKPGTLNGQPVDVIFNLTVNFKLN